MKKETEKSFFGWGKRISPILIAFLVGLLLVIVPYHFSREQATKGLVEIELLYVQVAERGFYHESTNGAFITLEGVSDSTIWFADRPDRLTGQESTASFVERWSDGVDNFVEDPPNAALEFITAEGESKVVIFELENPKYNQNSKTLLYQVTRLAEATVTHYDDSPVLQEVPKEFSNVVLFIDADREDLQSVEEIDEASTE